MEKNMKLKTRLKKLENIRSGMTHIIIYDPALKTKQEAIRDYRLPILNGDQVIIFQAPTINKPKNAGL